MKAQLAQQYSVNASEILVTINPAEDDTTQSAVVVTITLPQSAANQLQHDAAKQSLTLANTKDLRVYTDGTQAATFASQVDKGKRMGLEVPIAPTTTPTLFLSLGASVRPDLLLLLVLAWSQWYCAL